MDNWSKGLAILSIIIVLGIALIIVYPQFIPNPNPSAKLPSSGSSWILFEEHNMGGSPIQTYLRFTVTAYSNTAITYVMAMNDSGTWIDTFPETITFDNFAIDSPPLWVIKSNLSVGSRIQGSGGYTITDTSSRSYLGITHTVNHVHVEIQGMGVVDDYFDKYTGILLEMHFTSGIYYTNYLLTGLSI